MNKEEHLKTQYSQHSDCILNQGIHSDVQIFKTSFSIYVHKHQVMIKFLTFKSRRHIHWTVAEKENEIINKVKKDFEFWQIEIKFRKD